MQLNIFVFFPVFLCVTTARSWSIYERNVLDTVSARHTELERRNEAQQKHRRQLRQLALRQIEDKISTRALENYYNEDHANVAARGWLPSSKKDKPDDSQKKEAEYQRDLADLKKLRQKYLAQQDKDKSILERGIVTAVGKSTVIRDLIDQYQAMINKYGAQHPNDVPDWKAKKAVMEAVEKERNARKQSDKDAKKSGGFFGMFKSKDKGATIDATNHHIGPADVNLAGVVPPSAKSAQLTIPSNPPPSEKPKAQGGKFKEEFR